MTDDALAAWRTREGTALLVAYGALAAALSFGLAVMPQTAPAYAGLPFWLRFASQVFAIALVASTLLPALRVHAFRLQALNVGVCFAALVGIFMDKRNDGTWIVMVVICLFAFQYAFMRWEELVGSYAAAPLVYVALATAQHVRLPIVLQEAQTLTVVAAVSVGLGSVRLRMPYAAAHERLKLERQSAELRRQTDQKARMAFTDHLTGLLNAAA